MLVCPPEHANTYRELLELLAGPKPLLTAPAGTSRAESVKNGLAAIITHHQNAAAPLPTHVLVHDAARPLVSHALINRVLDALQNDNHPAEAVIPALAVKDTIKSIQGDWIQETLPRATLVSVQTPQGFDLQTLHRAHLLAQTPELATDDAQLIEAMGIPVRWVAGDACNIKLTTPDDLRMLATFAQNDTV